MQSSSFTLATTHGAQLHVNRWLPDGPPKAVVQIAHGMAEHSDRYARFAERLTAAGYAVYANDHRGHGGTVRRPEDAGFFADKRGWDTVVEDMHQLTDHAREENPGLPIFLFGQSMGSFLSRSYAGRFGADLSGLILSSTTGSAGLLGQLGIVVAKAQGKLRGPRHPSGLLNALSFGKYNAEFKPNRTDFDWLSSDEAEVDKYIADERSGAVMSAGFFADMLGGLASINSDGLVSRVPKDLPIFLFSGDLDPVGEKGKGPTAVAEQYRRLGVKDVTLKLWPQGRHEMLNETNRDEVMDSVVDWLDAHLPVAD